MGIWEQKTRPHPHPFLNNNPLCSLYRSEQSEHWYETTQAFHLNNGLKTGTSPTDRMRFDPHTHHSFDLHIHHSFNLHTHHLFPALVVSSRYRNYAPAHIWWVSEDIFYHKLPLQPLLGGETARSVFSPV